MTVAVAGYTLKFDNLNIQTRQVGSVLDIQCSPGRNLSCLPVGGSSRPGLVAVGFFVPCLFIAFNFCAPPLLAAATDGTSAGQNHGD